MLRNTLTTLAAFAAIGFITAPTAGAEITLRNVDVAGIEIPIPSWSPNYVPGGGHPYKTGYNISNRYEFNVDPVTGEKSLKNHGFDNGCNGAC